MRLTPTVKTALQKAAAEDGRSMASKTEKILADWLREHGYLKKNGKRNGGNGGGNGNG